MSDCSYGLRFGGSSRSFRKRCRVLLAFVAWSILLVWTVSGRTFASLHLLEPSPLSSKPLGVHDVGSRFLGMFSGDLIDSIENAEHQLVKRFIRPNDVVIEFGGRYGTTSCEIAKSLKNSGKLAVIEPDRSVWDLLSRNLHVNNCKASLVMGVLSHETLLFTSSGYATRTVVNPNVSEYYRRSHKKHPSAEHTIVRYSFAEVQKLLGSTINTILLDCEGCLPNVIGELKAPLENGSIRTILIEADMPKEGGRMKINNTDCQADCVDYDKFFDYLVSNNYKEMDRFNDCDRSRSHIPEGEWCGSWIWHYAFQRILPEGP